MLSPKEIITVHELLIVEFGGMRGITEAGFGRLDGAAALPLASAFGEPLFPDIIAQAAALCYGLAKGHAFSDGNKRIALVALDMVLSNNGYELNASNDEAYTMMMSLADGTSSRDDLIAWTRAHSIER